MVMISICKTKPFNHKVPRVSTESAETFSATSASTRAAPRLRAFFLLLLLFVRQRRVDIQQAFRQRHRNVLVLEVEPHKKFLGIWNFQFILPRSDYQQRRFPGTEANISDDSNFTVAIDERATDQIAHVGRSRLKLSPFAPWNLQLASD